MNAAKPRAHVDRWPLTPAHGKNVLVTGGARGIGRMIAEGFARAGAQVFLTSRNADDCLEVSEELSRWGHVVALPIDVSADDGGATVVEALAGRIDGLHVLVNNAGVTWGAPIDDYPPAAFDRVWSVNVKAVFATTQALLPLLQAEATRDDPARVINVGSVDGLRVPASDNFAYSSSKAGVHMLTQHLATKLASRSIAVNAIAPGPFRSKMTAFIFDDQDATEVLEAKVPLGSVGQAEDIAALTTFLAGPGARWMTGAIIALDGGRALGR